MVVVDSSALIPIARTGELTLLRQVFDELHTIEEVKEETVEPGKTGSSSIEEAFNDIITTKDLEKDPGAISELEGIGETDSKVILLAEKLGEPLLANDKALIQIARFRENQAIWPTTVIIKAVREDIISETEGKRCVRNMVSEGMNLSPQVYDRVIRELEN